MRRITGTMLLIGLLFGCVGALSAQEQTTMTPPKVLVIIREFLKPGKAGSPHVKTESAFVRAFSAAKWPQHYLAMDSLSGKGRSLFFVGYDSFAAWEKDSLATQKDAALSAALDRAAIADGELLSTSESSAFMYRADQSLHAGLNIGQMRYFEITRFHVRPGHSNDWDAIVKIYKDAYEKAVPDAHWAVYQDMYGHDSGGVYLVINPMKSLAEVDKGFADAKKIDAALGEEGSKKAAELEAASVDESETNLFMFNPQESYPPDTWVTADPAFWKPKPEVPAKKEAPKPKQ